MNSEQPEDSTSVENAATLPQSHRDALYELANQLNKLCSLNYLYRISTQALLDQYSDLKEPYQDQLLFALNLNIEHLEQLETQLKEQCQHLLKSDL